MSKNNYTYVYQLENKVLKILDNYLSTKYKDNSINNVSKDKMKEVFKK